MLFCPSFLLFPYSIPLISHTKFHCFPTVEFTLGIHDRCECHRKITKKYRCEVKRVYYRFLYVFCVHLCNNKCKYHSGITIGGFSPGKRLLWRMRIIREGTNGFKQSCQKQDYCRPSRERSMENIMKNPTYSSAIHPRSRIRPPFQKLFHGGRMFSASTT